MRTLAMMLLGLMLATSADAEIRRSYAAKRDFKLEHPCPSTDRTRGACPGWVIDHIEPLACGGADAPANMQWQTVEEAKHKDRWERKGCEVKQQGEAK